MGYRKLDRFEQKDAAILMAAQMVGVRYLNTKIVDGVKDRLERYKDDSNVCLMHRMGFWTQYWLTRQVLRNGKLLGTLESRWSEFEATPFGIPFTLWNTVTSYLAAALIREATNER